MWMLASQWRRDGAGLQRAGGTKVTDWRPIGDRFERSSWRHSVPPEVFEPRPTQCRVARGVGDRDVPKPVLDGAGVDAVIGELVTASIPEPRRASGYASPASSLAKTRSMFMPTRLNERPSFGIPGGGVSAEIPCCSQAAHAAATAGASFGSTPCS